MEAYNLARKTGTTKRFSNLRWLILSMNGLLLLLNYGDRAAIGVAAPFIMKDFHFSPETWGLIISAFSFGYVPFCFLGGWASDKYGPRKVMGIAAIWWSVFTAMTTVGFNFISFVIIRIFFGFGEGPQAAVTAKTIGNWFPKRQLGSALGISQATTPLGGAIGTPVFVWLMLLTGNWKIPFIFLGVIGVLFAIGWFVIMRDKPEQHPWISAMELAVINEGREKETSVDNGPKATLGQCLKKPLVWIIAFSFFSYSWALNTFLSWFPTYLVNAHHINIHDLAISGSIPWIAGTIGLASGGIVTDWIGKKTGKTTASRKWLTVICLLGVAAAFIPSTMVTSTTGAVTLMAFAVFLLYLTGAQYWAIIAETFPLSHLGGIGGFVNALANLAGIVAPIVTGAVVQSTGSWGSGFVVGAIILAIGALSLAFFGKVGNGTVTE
ncbi:MFS transporter [Neobacillus sp. YIM B02564]|uniref:MFS transporter n=1 Tax=Neobacillus paridis TaxID=2803862 RepID=A0ABS1TTT5_9BACI|nr:MFS transporter [Neobacillus paridis]MBL4954726.1 MFS transporter [Neobacillus paridis]